MSMIKQSRKSVLFDNEDEWIKIILDHYWGALMAHACELIDEIYTTQSK